MQMLKRYTKSISHWAKYHASIISFFSRSPISKTCGDGMAPKIRPTFPGMMESRYNAALIPRDPRVKKLEKRFKSTIPRLIMNKKGTFDYSKLDSKTKINHFECIR